MGQELRRLLRLSKAANEARRTDRVRLKDRRDGMAKALDLKALHGLVFVKVLEAPGAAHPNDAALHLRGHEAPGSFLAWRNSLAASASGVHGEYRPLMKKPATPAKLAVARHSPWRIARRRIVSSQAEPQCSQT